MKDTIPIFLKNKLLQPKAISTKFPEEIQQFLIDYAKINNWGLGNNVKLIFKVLKQIKTELPECSYANCSKKVIITKEGIVSNGCCYQHAVKATNLEKYGVENSLNIEGVREKIKQTNLEKYGVENAAQSNLIQKKFESTMLKKYGVKNIMKNKKFSTVQQTKMKKTMLKKYGVEHAIHNHNIFKKYINRLYHYKIYTWQTGETVKLQGNEPCVLKELEDRGYKFNELITDVKDMPIILYEFEGKTHRYFPDFFIPSENLIIEVKSEWTLDAQLEKNKAKFKAVEQAGFNFKLEIR